MKRLLFALLYCISCLPFTHVHADQERYQPGPIPGTDVWITNYYSYGSDYGVDDERLRAGGWGDWYHFFIKFDLSQLPANATKVELQMYPFSSGGTPVSMPYDRMLTDWNENLGWYNTYISGTQVGTFPAPTIGIWSALTITDIYNGWKAGTYPNYGLRFRANGNNNQFSEFRSSDYATYWQRPKLVVDYNGANFGFPLVYPTYNSWSPYTAEITSVFDHQMVSPYDSTEDPIIVRAYTGEKGDNVRYSSTDSLTCMSQSSEQAFIINNHYVGAGDCGGVNYLSYNNHPGYDYPVPTETPVYAAAAGTVTEIQCPANPEPCTDYGRIRISHGSGYSTWYLHLLKQAGELVVGSVVTKSQHIGYSGQTSPATSPVGPHLHFEVRKNDGTPDGLPVDPYGWKGEWNTDPRKVDGKDNVCLWEACQ